MRCNAVLKQVLVIHTAVQTLVVQQNLYSQKLALSIFNKKSPADARENVLQPIQFLLQY